MPSARAAIPGSRSTSPRTTGAPAARCCPRSTPTCVARATRLPPAPEGRSVMYERFYNLRERPFSLTPDPDYLYPSRVHKEALSYLRYGIEGHAGFIVITGEIGSGKTTLLQTAMRGIDTRTAVARLGGAALDA